MHVTSVNGQVVGSGPTRSIGGETRFDGFDVTGHLRSGPNAISVTAGTSVGQQFLARLVIALADGQRIVHGTDPSWRSLPVDPMLHTGGDLGTVCYPLPAENLDLRRYPWGFEHAGFDDGAWSAAEQRPPLPDLVPTPTAKVRHSVVMPQAVRSTGDGRIVVDYGRSWLGGVRLRTKGARGAVTVRYGERLDDDGAVRYRTHSGNTYSETLIGDGEDRSVQPWGLRVFRYAEISGLTAPVAPSDVAAVAQIYPMPPTAASFASSDPVLDRVWHLSAHTIRALNGNLYVDSWTRERLVYEADVYLQQRAHLCLDPDPSLGRYSTTYAVHNRTWPTEWPFYTVLAVHDAWMRTGDSTHAQQVFDSLLALLPDRYLDPSTGLIRKAPGTDSTLDSDLVDWPPAERHGYRFGPVNTAVNAIAAAAYQAAAEIAAVIGRDVEQARLTGIASRLRNSISTLLFDDAQGAFADGLDEDGALLPHDSVHASAFCLWAGVPTPEQADSAAHHAHRQGLRCSVYVAALLIDGLFAQGHGDRAVALLTSRGTRGWAAMLDLGAGSTMEAWNERIKPNLTHSHPWGAAPAFLALEGVLGIRPLDPGYRTFAVRPQLGTLDHAAGALPTVTGTIEVAAHRVGRHIQLDVTVPTGLRAVILHEDGSEHCRVPAGRHRTLTRSAEHHLDVHAGGLGSFPR
nr:family 78 glycoside hydrolase catalytic domain [Jiangella endophytica]